MSGFATPKKPTPKRPATSGISTPASKRKALRERNTSYVSGSHMAQASIASIQGNIFQGNDDVASSTLKPEQIVSTYFVTNFVFIKPN